MSTWPILVVEDNQNLREAIVESLQAAGFSTLEAHDGCSALSCLKRHTVCLVISDAQVRPMDGYTLFSEIQLHYPHIPFVLMTAHGDIKKAIDLLRRGASHYVLKPFEMDVLLAEAARYAVREFALEHNVIVAESTSMRDLLALAKKVAVSDATVLLTGESGVGKEVIARYLHHHSLRMCKPFVAVNCAAIPDSLLESTLFGHEKGAFTGASAQHLGKFEQAQGGTLLLDEISEMPLLLQAKLLRVLQEREIERVGSRKVTRIDIRIIATSNRDMAVEVQSGRFREDLYFRLNVFPLRIAPLRERPDDIVPLAQNMLNKLSKGRVSHCKLTERAAVCLTEHRWEGNIRELENVIQRASILAEGGIIDEKDLLLPTKSPTEVSVSQVDLDAGANMRNLEKKHILETLALVGGSRKLAAERLGISERTLRYKLQRYREDVEPVRGSSDLLA